MNRLCSFSAVVALIAATLPWPLIAAMWIAGMASTLVLAGRRAWQGRALIWNIAAIALSLTLPGLSFLFLLPAIAMNIPWRPKIAVIVACFLFFPLGFVLYIALGGTALPAIAVLLAIVASTFTA